MGLDAMGNMFAERAGEDPDALPVYVGSHLDTQPTGGKYDGVLGVLGGLEIVRSLNDLGVRTKHPIVVTNWTNEEGTRFAPAMLASGVFAGMHEQSWAEDRTDATGARFGDELDRIGWRGDEEVGARRMHAFFELHIEQGPILEAEGTRYRRRHPRAGALVAPGHAHGQGRAYRLHPDGDARERRPRHGAHHRGRAPHRDGRAARRRGRGGAGQRLPQLAQRDPGEGGLHHRLPLAGPGQARRDEGAAGGGGGAVSPPTSASASRSSPSAISTP